MNQEHRASAKVGGNYARDLCLGGMACLWTTFGFLIWLNFITRQYERSGTVNQPSEHPSESSPGALRDARQPNVSQRKG